MSCWVALCGPSCTSCATPVTRSYYGLCKRLLQNLYMGALLCPSLGGMAEI